MKTPEILAIVTQYETVKERAIRIGDLISKGRVHPSAGYPVQINIDEFGVALNWEQTCARSCCSDSYCCSFPLEYFELTDEQIKEAEARRIAAAKAEQDRIKAEQEAIEAKKREEEKETRDRREFERLKKKYDINS